MRKEMAGGGLRKSILRVAFIALVVSSASAQNNPSLEETLKWLRSFLPNATGAKAEGGKTYSEKRTTHLDLVEGCEIRLTINTDSVNNGRQNSSGYTLQFSLAEIDPSTIRTDVAFNWNTGPQVFAVVMETRGKTKTILVHGDNADKDDTSRVWSFAERATAERTQNAFRHAAELCGKAEPF